tara:strand:- start:2274 stop:3653 length:1380 start_codon:yes stop_codon:yes gene_type:complete
MIKAIIFDLDGVLVSTKELHYKALNKALNEIHPKYVISHDEHLKIYDGLPTIQKLSILSKNKGLSEDLYEKISINKQKYTKQLLNDEIHYSPKIFELFNSLHKFGFKIAIATNSISSTLEICIKKLKIKNFLNFYISNEMVTYPKPGSEMYLRCFIELGVDPKDALIIEDSSHGRLSALRSGANLFPLDNMIDLVKENIMAKIDSIKNQANIQNHDNRWHSDNLNILIPMAGHGSRFKEKGFSFPKPLIEVMQKPMIQFVVDNLNIKAQYIFIVLREHYDQYNLKFFLNSMTPSCKIVIVEDVTEGAACTSLLAKDFINNEKMLLIANSDQFIEWDSSETMYYFQTSGYDGGILCFNSVHPKWSYAKVENGLVTEVAEKKPISDLATVGIYFWKKGSDYVKYAESMIKKNIRVNNEFYICPVFNEAISDGKKIVTKNVDKMYGLGTPEDLDFFVKNYKS